MFQSPQNLIRKMSLDSQQLDTSRCDRKVWLVKVPPSVAAVWRPLCLQALQSSVDENDESHNKLGVISITAASSSNSHEASPNALVETTLTLKGPPSMLQGLPLTYNMNQVPSDPGSSSVMALSVRAQPPASSSAMQGSQVMEGVTFSHPSLDGTIDMTFTLSVKAGEGDQMDEAYRNMSKQRAMQAASKNRTIKEYQNSREDRVATLANRKVILKEKLVLAKDQKRKLREDKRLRWERPKLEAELFRLFEKQDMWNAVSLQQQTEQPMAFLREVLVDIAIVHKFGPLKDNWELKPEYKERAPQ
jgi:hypothetical protein